MGTFSYHRVLKKGVNVIGFARVHMGSGWIAERQMQMEVHFPSSHLVFPS
jgi:hypothetical protein